MATPRRLPTDEQRMLAAKKELPIVDIDYSVGDQFEEMYRLQKIMREFFMKYTKLGMKNQHERTEYYCMSIISEACELLENVRGWKPHQRNTPPVDMANVHEELSDMMHFLLNLYLEWDIDTETAYEDYHKKHMINRKRQQDGY